MHRLHSNSFSDLGTFLKAPSANVSCENGGGERKLYICVGLMLRGRAASIKQKQKKNIKQNIERADRDWKYWCKRFRRVNRQFSSSSSKKDGEQYEPKSLRSFALRFDRYLRKKDYSTIIMEGMELRKTKEALVANQKWLKKEGKTQRRAYANRWESWCSVRPTFTRLLFIRGSYQDYKWLNNAPQCWRVATRTET